MKRMVVVLWFATNLIALYGIVYGGNPGLTGVVLEKVSSSEKRPLVRAQLTLFSVGPSVKGAEALFGLRVSLTDQWGRFAFYDLPPGPYDLLVKDYQGRAYRIPVVAPPESEIQVIVLPNQGRALPDGKADSYGKADAWGKADDWANGPSRTCKVTNHDSRVNEITCQ